MNSKNMCTVQVEFSNTEQLNTLMCYLNFRMCHAIVARSTMKNSTFAERARTRAQIYGHKVSMRPRPLRNRHEKPSATNHKFLLFS